MEASSKIGTKTRCMQNKTKQLCFGFIFKLKNEKYEMFLFLKQRGNDKEMRLRKTNKKNQEYKGTPIFKHTPNQPQRSEMCPPHTFPECYLVSADAKSSGYACEIHMQLEYCRANSQQWDLLLGIYTSLSYCRVHLAVQHLLHSRSSDCSAEAGSLG